MSVDDTVAPERQDVLPHTRSGLRSFADRWPFRRKLNILVGVPLIVLALLLGYVISGLVGQAQDAASAARLVRDSRQVALLVDRVDTEHQQALLLSVRYESATTGTRPSLTAYRRAQAAVDSQVDKVRSAFGSRLPDAEAQELRQINGMGGLRNIIEQSYLPADNIDPAYISAANDLIDGLGLDLTGNLSSTRTGSLLDSLLRADAAHSSFETSVFSAQTGDANALIEFNNAVGSDQLYASEAARFGRFATDRQRTEIAGMEQGSTWNEISLQYAGLQIDPGTLVAKSNAEVKADFTKAIQTYPDYLRQSQNRLRVTNSLIDQIATRADRASNQAWWRAAWLLAGALLGFALWLALSVAIRRSVVRPVQALTGAAAQVAEVAGQELARVADDDAADAGPPRLREVPVTARDEIGDLANAFNRVQTTAAALLERQVLSRRNVAEMFGNVGRRVSNLTARQLSLIDAVERGETDPALLERLYRIDHLAVRLQRNADSLMLLAGIRETGMEASPTALTNVVRAALGQIEGYQRVSLTADTEVTVAPDIIADLTLMLAELLENAVSFSPARSPVEVTVRAGSEGAAIEVIDHGLGMSAERLAEENARLIRRERLDLVPTKVLGLFVVGSLARRWGVRVTLTRTPGGGVTSRVAIPSSLLLMMSPFAEPRPIPTDQPAPEPVSYDPAAYAPAPERAIPLPPRAPAEPLPSRPPAEPLAPAPTHAALTAGPHPHDPAPDDPAPQDPALQDPAPLPRRQPRRQATPPAAPTPAASPMPTPAQPDQPVHTPPGAPSRAAPADPHADPATAPAPYAQSPAAPAAGSSPLTRRIPGATSGAYGDPQPAAAPGYGGSPEHGRPTAGGESARPTQGGADGRPGSGGAPLRRRVRGATLRTTWADDTERAAAPRPAADAEAVRSELDEFEAAVERANRDSRTTTDLEDIEAAVGRANRDTRSSTDAGFQEGAEE